VRDLGGVFVPIGVVEHYRPSSAPRGFIHLRVKSHRNAGLELVIALRHHRVYSFGSGFRFQIEKTPHDNITVAGVGDQYFEIPVEHPQAATGLEVEDILNTGIHVWCNNQHCNTTGYRLSPVWR
jgi:hypothetical protein